MIGEDESTRAHELLGWSPKQWLRETLPKMVAAMKEDPTKFYTDNKLVGSPARVTSDT